MQFWRLIKSPPSDAFTNMAVDETILRMVACGNSPPTLRFYSWDPPAVSIGYFQDSLIGVDREACREMGVDIVRRLTGGRAVLHDRELTYSVTCPKDDPCFSDSILETYKVISSCLVTGLNRLGLNASLTPAMKRRGGRNSSSACFSSASFHEITVSGKKLVGSAQKRGDGVFLQHGSILTEFHRNRLENVLRDGGDLSDVTSIGEYMDVDVDTLIDCLIKGFEDGLVIQLKEGSLTNEENALVGKLIEDRYSKDGWNLKGTNSAVSSPIPS